MKKEYIFTNMSFDTEHFSQGVKAGKTIYVSGKTARDEHGNMVSDDFEAQTVQSFENVKLTLEAAGASLSDVVKCTVYLKDINNLGKFREIRNRYFTPPRPASTAVEVSGLVPGAIVEIDAIAVVD